MYMQMCTFGKLHTSKPMKELEQLTTFAIIIMEYHALKCVITADTQGLPV